MEVNQTVHNVWQSPALVHYIYIFRGSCPLMEFCQVQNSLESKSSCILLFWQHYCTALKQWPSAKLCGLIQGMELRNFCSSSFSTEGATYIPRVATTLGIGPHSSFLYSYKLLLPPSHHNRFTALFPGPPGWAGARRELLNFMVQGKINRGRHKLLLI